VYDCLVVGGGITGLTAALLLQKRRKSDDTRRRPSYGIWDNLAGQVHTLTPLPTPTYKEAESAFGEEGANFLPMPLTRALQSLNPI